ncbi:ATP synthase subunit alpha [Diplonema papillatum]|nr:ATP synthase subunit alpha [Diplonema papillatum]
MRRCTRAVAAARVAAAACAASAPRSSLAPAVGAIERQTRFASEAAEFKATPLVGHVHSIDGTIATVAPAGVGGSASFNSVVKIQTSKETEKGVAHAVVFNLNKDGSIGVILLDNTDAVRSGQPVYATEELLKIPVGFGVLGKVINPLGHEIPTSALQRSRALFNEDIGQVDVAAPNIIQRQPVNYNLTTGFKVVDTMIPIGRGQRELIVGDRQTGKTSIAVSTIINQVRVNQQTLRKNNVVSVYVSVGQRCSNVARIYRLLGLYNALQYSVIMAATAADPAGLQYLAPFSGVTICEKFRDAGRHSLIIYDDLSKQAVAYRQLSLLLRRPPGREAYPGDVFYLHSRLLERAAMMSPGMGGGSLTALPIVETLSNDVTAYIVTNVISITDGQIYLDAKLFTGGQRPAVNIGLSVSRVGSAAQNKAMKGVSGALKSIISEYRKLAADSVGGQTVVSKEMIRGSRSIALFNQKGPSYFLHAIIAMYACLHGFMDEVKLNYIKFYEYLLVFKDLSILYNNAQNKFFYMYVSSLNYLVRFFTLNHKPLKAELDAMLTSHTQLFLTHYQARMNLIKSDKELVALKNLLYSCKRAV